MNFKKIVALSLSVVLSIGVLAGCESPKVTKTTDENTKKVATAADLNGAKVGVQEGTTGDLYVSEKMQDAKVSRFKKALDAVMDLKNGSLDAVVIDDQVAKNIVASNKGVKILPDILTQEEYAIAVSKENSELKGQINTALKELYADGTIDKIHKAYVTGDAASLAEFAAKEAPKGEKKLKMATNAEFPPFEFRDDKNEITGYDVEIAKEIARKLNMGLEVEDMALDSLFAALAGG
ncbi:MAG: transporter substrate-binding domain-containing protein, partial [Oscillospiraceae bacterium]